MQFVTNTLTEMLHDNVCHYIAASVHDKIAQFDWEVLQHPIYSPDLAPLDFICLGPQKIPRWPTLHIKFWSEIDHVQVVI